MMTIRQILATSIAAVALVSTPALHAAPTSIVSPIHAAFGKQKMVKISFFNDSGTPIELKIGDEIVKLDTGKTIDLHLAVGVRVLSNTATSKMTVGTVIAEVAPSLNGATLRIL